MSCPLLPKLAEVPVAFYRENSVSKDDFLAIKFDEKDINSRKIYLRMEETISIPLSAGLTVKDLPWDIVIIMTKSWLLVVRPEPQPNPQRAEEQARGIWAVAKKFFGESNTESSITIDTMFCWMFVPSTDPFQDIGHVLPASERKDIYQKVLLDEGMQKLGSLKNGIFLNHTYHLTKSVLPDESLRWRSKVVIHDTGSAADIIYHGQALVKRFPDSNYLEQLYPSFSVITLCHMQDLGGFWGDAAIDKVPIIYEGPLS